MNARTTGQGPGSSLASAALALMALTLPQVAHASFLPPEIMGQAAFYLAWFIIVVVPIGGIILFLMVHVLPEKIAHKRHHPQRDAIQVLCLLSLFFGGLLWPIAWLWAFVKPVGYQAAYGTDKHDDYYHAVGEKALAGELTQHELDRLREELDRMADRQALSPELRLLRQQLATAKPAPEVPTTAMATTAAGRV